nr:MAG TPA: hypothetical protein [Caudoviricetes sp.]
MSREKIRADEEINLCKVKREGQAHSLRLSLF